MKVSVDKPHAPYRELLRGAAAIAVGAALAYGGAHLFALLRLGSPPVEPETFEVVPQVSVHEPAVVEPTAPGEDPWWRGDAEFWQEQARLNSAVVPAQYRDLQFAWSEKMATNARQRALQDASGQQPQVLPAKQAQTTELQIPEKPRR
ncbi:hypothetical protein SAMN05216588_13414 [Pseudomonas flavescens]|uniref:Uncharacterized protein n=1 Tax=Phytopseudomonas flavescens TaxID=29435 RepID=A0A1G8QB58_9GAMM|nr:hypothetical protein [Pseudomonas flavescens]SDJ01828.1 hypothetical protein SAMN05216588_13414 [Pseudomonas flavescens]